MRFGRKGVCAALPGVEQDDDGDVRSQAGDHPVIAAAPLTEASAPFVDREARDEREGGFGRRLPPQGGVIGVGSVVPIEIEVGPRDGVEHASAKGLQGCGEGRRGGFDGEGVIEQDGRTGANPIGAG